MVVGLKRISQRHIRLILKVRALGKRSARVGKRDQPFVSRASVSWCIVWCILPCNATLATPRPVKPSVGLVRQVPDEKSLEKLGR